MLPFAVKANTTDRQCDGYRVRRPCADFGWELSNSITSGHWAAVSKVEA
jgi:hypothetical protein